MLASSPWLPTDFWGIVIYVVVFGVIVGVANYLNSDRYRRRNLRRLQRRGDKLRREGKL